MTRTVDQTPEDLEVPLLYSPRIPIIYLTNESELGPIESYVRKCKDRIVGGEAAECPAIWTVSRAGHNWTNQR